MSESIVFPLPDGASYTIPDVNDENWGQNVTNFLVAIPNGVPPRNGTFSLTGDLSFGATYGLKSNYYKSLTTNISSTGVVRLAKTDAVSWRNNANSADLALGINGSDQILFNGSALALASGTVSNPLTGDLNANSHKITNLTNGSSAQDAAAFGQIPVITAPTVQRFTSGSGTYTKPTSPSPLYIRLKMSGGGGGGAGSGSSGGGNGGNGNASTFGGTALAGGGYGGNWGTITGGQGGTNTTTGIVVINQAGGNGAGGQEPGVIAQLIGGGSGGSNPFGGFGQGRFGTANNGVGNSGGGGGGCELGSATTGASGSGGGSGGYMDLIITSPSSTYSYAVGTGGTGGSAGTSGGAGGSGGSGIIIVEEFYQ